MVLSGRLINSAVEEVLGLSGRLGVSKAVLDLVLCLHHIGEGP